MNKSSYVWLPLCICSWCFWCWTISVLLLCSETRLHMSAWSTCARDALFRRVLVDRLATHGRSGHFSSLRRPDLWLADEVRQTNDAREQWSTGTGYDIIAVVIILRTIARFTRLHACWDSWLLMGAFRVQLFTNVQFYMDVCSCKIQFMQQLKCWFFLSTERWFSAPNATLSVNGKGKETKVLQFKNLLQCPDKIVCLVPAVTENYATNLCMWVCVFVLLWHWSVILGYVK